MRLDDLLEWATKALLFGFIGFLLFACLASEVQCRMTGREQDCPHLVRVQNF